MKKIITAILVLSLAFLAACGSTSATSGSSSPAPAAVQKITAADAKAKLDAGDPLVFLDVRTAKEYAEGHIPGALLLPNSDIGSAKPEILPVADAEIIVYCNNGMSSADAAQKLVKLGYTKVFDLGGIKDWTYGTESGEWAAKAASWSSFRSATIEGAPVDESIFSGHKLNMVNVWATFCGPCLNEMPDLGSLSGEYSGKGVQIIGVVLDSLESDGSVSQAQVEYARELVSKTGASYIHILPTADLMNAGLGAVSSVPTTFFFDENGNQVGQPYVGSRSSDDWQQIIDSLLAGQS